MDLDKNIFSKDLSELRLNLDLAALIIVYRQYKNFVLPIFTIAACIFVFILVLMPQVQNIINENEQRLAEEKKLTVLKNNYNLLLGMDEAALNSNYNTLSKALPPFKDFAGILNTISVKSVESGVSVADFSFSVGNVKEKPSSVTGTPSLSISLNVSGGTNSMLSFMKALYKSMPLCEILSVNQSGSGGQIKMQFFYKALPEGSLNATVPIGQMSTSELSLIDTLTSWKTDAINILPINSIPVASESSRQASAGGEIFNPF